MNEGAKTLTYLGAALLVAIIAVISIPRAPSDPAETPTGTMFNAVEDPLSAAELRIVEFNEETSDAREFEVVHSPQGWVIPSHSGYPADAEEQMEAAASTVMNLKILSVASVDRGAHDTYGVVDPEDTKTTTGSKGVGARVTMKDKAGKTLVEMIVGKEVKGQAGQRYVREVGKEPVYVVELDASKLSTSFDQWIEKDLLSLNAFDVSGLQLKDYSIEFSIGFDGRPQALMDPRSEIFLHNDPNAETAKQWEIVSLKEFNRESGEYAQVPVPEGVKIDGTKLNELKNALDDLKIVDVERKPEGLSADLQAEKEFVTNEEAFRSLAARGFYPVPISETELEILSSEGEVVCQMNDGVEYVLRFGKTVASSQPGGDSSDGEDAEDSGINRYLFITARFNEDLIPQPDLTPVPGAPPAEEPDQDAPEDSPAETPPADAPAKTDTPDADRSEDTSDEGSADESPADGDDSATEDLPDDATPPSDEDEAAIPPVDAAEAAADEAEEDTKAEGEQTPPAEESAANQPPAVEPTSTQPDDAADTEATPPEVDDAERKRIEAENKVKQDEYDTAVQQGQDRVKELNARFGDWYYVISDSVYKKIHLGRQDILEEPIEPKDGLDSLQDIENEGLGQPKPPQE